MNKVGLVTTIPVEVLFAAGAVPVDLNNSFITSLQPAKLVEQAEIEGFPRNTCSWVKGVYAAARQHDIGVVIAVMRGDCSNNEAMAEVLQAKGVEVVPFSYPYPRSRYLLRREIERLMKRFGVRWDAVDDARRELDVVRSVVLRLDELTWQTEAVSGFENHLYCVSCSDFNGDYHTFEQDLTMLLDGKLAKLEDREAPRTSAILRLGYVGVPPIFTDLYGYLESLGARVVYNEMQRQFAMPEPASDLVQQYLNFTYPYDIYGRIADIRVQVKRRKVDALIHYVQSFCHHQIQDIVLRQEIGLPILTLEGDRAGRLDARSKMRLESFVDMCRQRQLAQSLA